MIEMIIIGAVSVIFGVLILIAFYLGYKAGQKDMPELPSQEIKLEDVGISEEAEFDGISDDDYLKTIRDFEEIEVEKPKEPEHIE